MASRRIGNVHTHLAVFTEISNISVYVCKYAKNNQRREVKMDIAHLQQRNKDERRGQGMFTQPKKFGKMAGGI